MQRVHDVARRRHLARSTVERYVDWIEQFLRFCRLPDRTWRHPRDLGAGDVGGFLTHLARDRKSSASSQNQATCAIVFLFKHVFVEELGQEHLGRSEFERSRRPVRVPTVLSADEASRLLAALSSTIAVSLRSRRAAELIQQCDTQRRR